MEILKVEERKVGSYALYWVIFRTPPPEESRFRTAPASESIAMVLQLAAAPVMVGLFAVAGIVTSELASGKHFLSQLHRSNQLVLRPSQVQGPAPPSEGIIMLVLPLPVHP